MAECIFNHSIKIGACQEGSCDMLLCLPQILPRLSARRHVRIDGTDRVRRGRAVLPSESGADFLLTGSGFSCILGAVAETARSGHAFRRRGSALCRSGKRRLFHIPGFARPGNRIWTFSPDDAGILPEKRDH